MPIHPTVTIIATTSSSVLLNVLSEMLFSFKLCDRKMGVEGEVSVRGERNVKN